MKMTDPLAYPYIMSENSITIFDMVLGEPFTVDNSSPIFSQLTEAISRTDWMTVSILLKNKRTLLEFEVDKLIIRDGVATYDGEQLSEGLSKRLINIHERNMDLTPMVNFLNNLFLNPSRRAIKEFYDFMDNNNLPITSDGYFLAYKKVRNDYTDIHTGTFDNSVGEYIWMHRNRVCDDKDKTCSDGLHFCSVDYLPHFGSYTSSNDRIVVVKIDPADVVSFPTDYKNSKGRTSAYTVVGELDAEKYLPEYYSDDYDIDPYAEEDGYPEYDLDELVQDIDENSVEEGDNPEEHQFDVYEINNPEDLTKVIDELYGSLNEKDGEPKEKKTDRFDDWEP